MMTLLKSLILWLLNHPQYVLGCLALGGIVLIFTKKKWRKKQPFWPWVLTGSFILYVFAFIRFYDRIELFRPVLKNNTPETLAQTALADDHNYCFGIDISQYQGAIHWEEVLLTKHPLRFVLVRATMGKDGVDAQYGINWRSIKQCGFKRGAYHYYRPSENSTQQAQQFITHVELEKGDLPPVLDVERMSIYGFKNLREGVQNWLKIIGKHYNCKPIVYTGRYFYEQYLKGSIEGYPLWIASYGPHHKVAHLPWTMYQFSEKMVVHGINCHVDGNFFKGDIAKLRNFGL
jgi:GH25 family lysozyme M1 (1,4-beta-N-acetylmuramidase)